MRDVLELCRNAGIYIWLNGMRPRCAWCLASRWVWLVSERMRAFGRARGAAAWGEYQGMRVGVCNATRPGHVRATSEVDWYHGRERKTEVSLML